MGLLIFRRQYVEDEVLSAGVTPSDLGDFHVFGQFDYLERFIIFDALIHIEFCRFQSEIPLLPSSLFGENHFENVDSLILFLLEESREILRFELLIHVDLFAPLDIVKAEPDRRRVDYHRELFVLLKYNLVFLLLSILHDKICQDLSVLDFNDYVVSVALSYIS